MTIENMPEVPAVETPLTLAEIQSLIASGDPRGMAALAGLMAAAPKDALKAVSAEAAAKRDADNKLARDAAKNARLTGFIAQVSPVLAKVNVSLGKAYTQLDAVNEGATDQMEFFITKDDAGQPSFGVRFKATAATTRTSAPRAPREPNADGTVPAPRTNARIDWGEFANRLAAEWQDRPIMCRVSRQPHVAFLETTGGVRAGRIVESDAKGKPTIVSENDAPTVPVSQPDGKPNLLVSSWASKEQWFSDLTRAYSDRSTTGSNNDMFWAGVIDAETQTITWVSFSKLLADWGFTS